jgi:ABC-type nitrate/sulfonate/bicarbonate transport system permease component
MRGTLRIVALRSVLPVLVIVLWWVLSADSTSVFWPPLSKSVDAFRHNWLFHRFGTDVVPSLYRMFAGYLIAAVAGIALGLFLGLSPLAQRALNPSLQFIRALPGTTQVLIFLVILGPTDRAKIIIIAVACVWPVLLNTIDGVRSLDPTLEDVARCYRLTFAQRVRCVLLPYSAPQIAVGLRTSLGVAFIVMIASEFLGGSDGIGYFTLGAATILQMPDMWSGILLLGVLGFGVNAVFTLAEARALKWYYGEREQAAIVIGQAGA